MRFKHKFEYGLLRATIFIINLFPVPLILAFSTLLGWIVWIFYPYRLNVAYSNLTNVFPDMEHGDKLKHLRKAYLNFTKTFGLIFILHRKQLFNLIINAEISGKEILADALAEGKGVILTTYHGSWFEAYFAWFNHYKLPTSLIYQEQRNPLSNDYFLRQRGRYGTSLENISTHEGTKVFQEALEKSRILIVSLDQSYLHKGTKIPFFNRELGCAKGTAILHLRTDAPVLTSVYYLKDNKLHIDFERVSLPSYNEINEDNIADITSRSIKWYEPYIRTYPEQWFSLFHRLWSKKGYPKKIERSFRQIFQ